MKQFRQPLLTILIIFATAYILSLIGCAPSGSDLKTPPAAASNPVNQGDGSAPNSVAELRPVDPAKISECKDTEFAALQSWANLLAVVESDIKNLGPQAGSWKKKDDLVKTVIIVINKCDHLQAYHLENPCKKTVQTIVSPQGTVKVYDAYSIQKRCKLPSDYLAKFNLRPDPKVELTSPGVVKPPVSVGPATPGKPAPVNPPVVVNPPQASDSGSAADVAARDIHECNDSEFTNLKSWKAALDLANKNVAKLGSAADWKYETNAVDSSSVATGQCESLASYHQAQPCKRYVKNDKTNKMDLKIYNSEGIRQQCQNVRAYHYEFLQQDSSLIVPNAKLFFDTYVIANVTINKDYTSGKTIGQCIVSNRSAVPVTYTGQKVLIKEARVYPVSTVEGFQMFTMVTADDIKFECYGLNYSSAKSSKNEVVRLLKQKQTDIKLSYELN